MFGTTTRTGGPVQYRIRRFGIQSTALTVGILYFVIALVFMPFFYLATRGDARGALPGFAFLLGPFIYAVIGYLIAALGSWLYNLIAGWSGGVAFTLEPDGDGGGAA
jgi:hypothetical protein